MKWTQVKLDTGANGWHRHVQAATVNIVFICGISDSSDRFFDSLEQILPNQAHIWTLDLRGFGVSQGDVPGHFGDSNGTQQIVEDICALCQNINNPHPVVIIGHSTGGLFTLLALSRMAKEPELAILSSVGIIPTWELQIAKLLFALQKWRYGKQGYSHWIKSNTNQKYARELNVPIDGDWRSFDPVSLDSLAQINSSQIEATVGSWCEILHALGQIVRTMAQRPQTVCLLLGGSNDPSIQFGVAMVRLSNALVNEGWACHHQFVSGASHDIWKGKPSEKTIKVTEEFILKYLPLDEFDIKKSD